MQTTSLLNLSKLEERVEMSMLEGSSFEMLLFGSDGIQTSYRGLETSSLAGLAPGYYRCICNRLLYHSSQRGKFDRTLQAFVNRI